MIISRRPGHAENFSLLYPEMIVACRYLGIHRPEQALPRDISKYPSFVPEKSSKFLIQSSKSPYHPSGRYFHNPEKTIDITRMVYYIDILRYFVQTYV